MCGIFGFSSYGEQSPGKLTGLTNSLARQSAERGLDATGIAYNGKQGITINKEARSAYTMKFKNLDNFHALIGHTRHATHGSAQKNFNNHPFYGRCQNTNFALVHNGIIGNADALRKQYSIPVNKIETDSYIAVQLLEHNKLLDESGLKFMAESLSGSFSFAVLDSHENIYIVKGDSPVAILHFPADKLYVFASTEQIVWKAVIESALFSSLKNNKYTKIDISPGQILKINPSGVISFSEFNYQEYYPFGLVNWYDYDFGNFASKPDFIEKNNDYLEDLKRVAVMRGCDPKEIDTLMKEGFLLEDIETYIYDSGI